MRVGVVIGRFQPLHDGHVSLLKSARSQCDKLVVLIGSTGCAPDFRNPWTFTEVSAMIHAQVNASVFKIEDVPYDDDAWVASVRGVVQKCIVEGDKVTLFGYKKDASSFYLSLFPEWKYTNVPKSGEVDATTVRQNFFRLINNVKHVPLSTKAVMHEMSIARFEKISDEARAIQDHDTEWASQGAENYGVQHVAVDCLVKSNDKFLLIRRGGKVGNGALALPGGFVNRDERILNAALRELQEETGLKVDRANLPAFAKMMVFDHPRRSMRGRIFTHALWLPLSDDVTKKAKAGDDAAYVHWMTMDEIEANKPQFFSDHYHIIKELTK